MLKGRGRILVCVMAEDDGPPLKFQDVGSAPPQTFVLFKREPGLLLAGFSFEGEKIWGHGPHTP